MTLWSESNHRAAQRDAGGDAATRPQDHGHGESRHLPNGYLTVQVQRSLAPDGTIGKDGKF